VKSTPEVSVVPLIHAILVIICLFSKKPTIERGLGGAGVFRSKPKAVKISVM